MRRLSEASWLRSGSALRSTTWAVSIANDGDRTCEVLVRINERSPGIADGVHGGEDEIEVVAGDQGIMFGYARDGIAGCMPLTHSMAPRLGSVLTEVREGVAVRPDERGPPRQTVQPGIRCCIGCMLEGGSYKLSGMRGSIQGQHGRGCGRSYLQGQAGLRGGCPRRRGSDRVRLHVDDGVVSIERTVR